MICESCAKKNFCPYANNFNVENCYEYEQEDESIPVVQINEIL